ncbi:nucleotidyl transferase AbiEii/AbiGii toxin family protein [Aurantimonas sp. DM33-3]|uniref:nucleotidyl transferase AbiEii/AbiGii toxin family protein n=1 Tax=Aurantimonas TaxID=182269 RepID=UPI00165261D2|nr:MULTISPECIES: nucleotidyl transferase AbiEii/AbiGii toxin family protein [Aurantimonas]MBC6716572.1 nucleotidyl transferase AbiEii/AbiGii toxin family protein [Aurantimonas sp. DM33-3]MCC4300029.1 nucleotidyl transferase AbiEii/AbiGii toxin family protein [Aurantimonas coralicida]
MALTILQRRILAELAANRSETSYVAGGVVLNKDWPRQSDDIDIFHDTDEEIGAAADRDMEVLRKAGYSVRVDIDVYGVVEAVVRDRGEETQIQWMSESKRRFLPLIRDADWGARLAPADLAVNKILAASSRRKARDFVDLASIGEHLCPLGPLVMAASGKPPHYSPQRILEHIQRNCLSIWNEDYISVKGLPNGWTAEAVRERVVALVAEATSYVGSAPYQIVGRLAVRNDGVPVEIRDMAEEGFQLRAPTEEPEAIPEFRNTASFGLP